MKTVSAYLYANNLKQKTFVTLQYLLDQLNVN